MMTIQQELAHARQLKFAKDMQSVYDKLNAMCLDLADMRLEDFAEIMQEYTLHLDDDDRDKFVSVPPFEGDYIPDENPEC